MLFHASVIVFWRDLTSLFDDASCSGDRWEGAFDETLLGVRAVHNMLRDGSAGPQGIALPPILAYDAGVPEAQAVIKPVAKVSVVRPQSKQLHKTLLLRTG